MKEKNGKSNAVKVEATFKRNVDYFELKAGTFYTLKALMAKYNCSNYHIYAKAKEFNVEKESILGQTVYKDAIKDGKPVFEKFAHVSPEFNKGTAEHLKAYRAVPFATLCQNVRGLTEQFERFLIQNDLRLDDITETVRSSDNRNEALSKQVVAISDRITTLEAAVHTALNYLTVLKDLQVKIHNIEAFFNKAKETEKQFNERNRVQQ